MKDPIVGLTGGLGNQLFQVAKALSISNRRILIDLESSGSYIHKRSDFLDFQTPDEICVINVRSSKLSRIFFARCIGNSVKLGKFAEIRGYILRFIFQLLFEKLNKTKVSVPKNSGIGYYPSPNVDNPYLIGYFQTWRWLESKRVIEILNSLKPAHESQELTDLLEKIKSENAVALHVRLGDYVKETKFGTLDEEYYLNALEEIDVNWKTRNLWVFSDDVHQARDILEEVTNSVKSIKFIGEIGNSPVNSMHLMRHARDFVIGNSTFSWWAAVLRVDRDGMVCAPNPWFIGIDTPRELLPGGWIRIESSFQSVNLTQVKEV
jgi:hypothetical protein